MIGAAANAIRDKDAQKNHSIPEDGQTVTSTPHVAVPGMDETTTMPPIGTVPMASTKNAAEEAGEAMAVLVMLALDADMPPKTQVIRL